MCAEKMEGGTAIEVDLIDNEVTMIKAVARRRRIGFRKAVDLCYSTGLAKAKELANSWDEVARHEGIHEQIVSLRAMKANKSHELMDIRSKNASANFNCFEEFSRMTPLLISYLGLRSQVIRLKDDLANEGIIVDISHGEIPDLDELTRRYLFRKESGTGSDS